MSSEWNHERLGIRFRAKARDVVRRGRGVLRPEEALEVAQRLVELESRLDVISEWVQTVRHHPRCMRQRDRDAHCTCGLDAVAEMLGVSSRTAGAALPRIGERCCNVCGQTFPMGHPGRSRCRACDRAYKRVWRKLRGKRSGKVSNLEAAM